MIFVARKDEAEAHRGRLLDVEQSAFAPPPPLQPTNAFSATRYLSSTAYARAYLEHLHRLWKSEPHLFDELVRESEEADVTLVDAWHEQPHAPRKVLAVVLKRLDIWEAAQARWHKRRGGALTPRG